LTALAALLVQCTLPAGQKIPEVCERVRVGPVPVGAACTEEGQCAPGARADTSCTGQSTDGQGVCTAPLKLGEPCSSTCTSSAVDLLSCPNCSWGSRDLSCGLPLVSNRASCFTNDGLYCSSSGSCASLSSAGEPCSEGGCAPGSLCVQGLCGSAAGLPCHDYDCNSANAYCDVKSQLCTPMLADGSPCTMGYQCASSQCTQGLCTRLLANEYVCSGQVAL
jgi:hypothetical protein